MSTYKNYIDRFNRTKGQKRDTSFDSKLNTDKEAYTQFLEVQLERLSQAILHVDSFNDKVEAVCTQVNSLEERLNNSNKLVKLLQSFADAQESDNIKVQEKFSELSRKIIDVNNSDSKRHAKEETIENLMKRLENIERKMDRERTNSSQNEIQYGKDFEQKIVDQVNLKIEGYLRNLKNFEERIEEKNDKFSEDIATDIRTLENRMSEFINRAGDMRHSRSLGGMNEGDLDEIKEELYQKIEVVMEELKNMASLVDFDELKTLLEKEILERKESFEQLEKHLYLNDKQYSELAENVVYKFEEFENKLQDLEFLVHRVSPRTTEKGENVPSFPEKKFAEEIRKLQHAVKEVNEKIDNSYTQKTRPSTSLDQSGKEDIHDLEKRMTNHMVDGFDRFSNVIKKHIDKGKKFEAYFEDLNHRLSVLEDKLPSRSRETENLKRQSNKSATILSEELTPKDILATKENPFLRGRLSSESKFNTLQVTEISHRKTGTEASFGDRYDKLKSSQNFAGNSASDVEETTKTTKDKKKEKNSKLSLRSRSRSASAKSLDGSFISDHSGKENKSPGLQHRHGKNQSRKSSAKKSRHTSPSVSASNTPKRKRSLKSPESFTSLRSQNKGLSEASGGRGSSNIQMMQNKIEMERKQREEKIKKLLKKSKPTTDTPKFQIKAHQSSKENKGTNPSTRQQKNVSKSSLNDELLDRNLKYDYNFKTTGDKSIISMKKDTKKYQKLDELYSKNMSHKEGF